MTMIRGFPGKSGEQNRFIAGSVAPDGIDRRKMLGSACACGLAALLDLKSATTLAADTVAGPARFIHAKLDATAQAIESKMIAWRRHRVSCYGQKRDTPFRQGVLAARENPMNDARKLGLEWQFVVAVVTAIILAAAGAGTIYALVHRPVAGSHPPVVESVAAPSLAAPEVSRPLTPDPPVAAQQPTEPQEVKSPAEASHIPRWGVWLAADVSETKAWTLYHEKTRQFASLIGDREPVVLFRQLPGLGNAKRYVIAIVDDDRAPLDKFCKKLTAAGSTCNVMRNEIGP